MDEDKKFDNGGFISGPISIGHGHLMSKNGREWLKCKKCGAVFEVYPGLPVVHECPDKLVLEGEWCGIEMEEYGEIKNFTTIGGVIFEDAVDNFLNISSENGGASGIKIRVTIEMI